MRKITVRMATEADIDAIHALFLDRFPFLQACAEKARLDVFNRVTRQDSATVVAILDDQLVAVARGYENQGLYLMNSICTASGLTLINSGRAIMALLPYFVEVCISHARTLGMARAFYATQVSSIAALVPKLCRINSYTILPGQHGDEEGFWIVPVEAQ